MFTDLKQQYRRSLKSLDTEENIDLAFYRPIGFAWAYLFSKIGITPNAVTIASIFLGIGAGICFYYSELYINVIGILMLIWANSYDSADGQLARMTKQYSPLGRILDGVAGDLWFASIYIAICLRTNLSIPLFGEHPWLIWLIAVITGICHAKQASMADYYRQLHLLFVNGKSGSELDTASDLKKQYAELSWGKNFFKKLTMLFYMNYTINQEAWTPAMQSLRKKMAERFPEGNITDENFRQEFRNASRPLMKYTNILSFNWRTITLFTSLFIGMPWLYFVCELTIFNALLIYMMCRHERICRRFVEKL